MTVGHSTIPKLLIDAIKANTFLASVLGGRIHYQTIPESSTFPHVYIARQSRTSETFLDGESGPVEDSYVIEVVAESFNAELCTELDEAMSALEGFLEDGTWIYCTDVGDVDDNYVFKSADSDALFLHAFQVTVYHS